MPHRDRSSEPLAGSTPPPGPAATPGLDRRSFLGGISGAAAVAAAAGAGRPPPPPPPAPWR
jgi:hypothetical protein